MLIAIPNGLLNEEYTDNIMAPGKSKESSLRFVYSKCSSFALFHDKPNRFHFLYKDESIPDEKITNIKI